MWLLLLLYVPCLWFTRLKIFMNRLRYRLMWLLMRNFLRNNKWSVARGCSRCTWLMGKRRHTDRCSGTCVMSTSVHQKSVARRCCWRCYCTFLWWRNHYNLTAWHLCFFLNRNLGSIFSHRLLVLYYYRTMLLLLIRTSCRFSSRSLWSDFLKFSERRRSGK